MKFKFNLFLFFVVLFVAYTLATPVNLEERKVKRPDGIIINHHSFIFIYYYQVININYYYNVLFFFKKKKKKKR